MPGIPYDARPDTFLGRLVLEVGHERTGGRNGWYWQAVGSTGHVYVRSALRYRRRDDAEAAGDAWAELARPRQR